MRGDSIQDLYAKIAAVLGLGLLALSGAVVDYWPVGVPLPTVAQALPRPTLGHARSVDAVLHQEKENQAGRSTPLARRAAFLTATPSTTLARVPDAPARSDAVIGVADPAPAPGTAVTSEPVAETEVIVTRPSPALATSTEASAALGAPIVFREGIDAGHDDGFFSSTVKKTGTSLMRTGASIRDAVRTIGVKVRSVFPG